MGTFFKKDMMIFIRDRKEFLVILLMPIVLIIILGFSLKGFISGEEITLNIQIALVNEDTEAEGLEAFKKEIDEGLYTEEEKLGIKASVDELRPFVLLEQLFANETVRDWVEVLEMDAESARVALQKEEITSILFIPPDFTYDTLKRMIMREGNGASLFITVGEQSPLRAQIFEEIITGFARTLNYDTALGQALGLEAFGAEEVGEIEGGLEAVNELAPLSSMQYYTLSMTVMFVLFVASSASGKAFTEKHQHVFDRMLLAGIHPLSYLSGKLASAACIVIGQIVILFISSQLLFQSFTGHPVSFWLAIASIISVLALCVGALTALLTSLNFRLDSPNASIFFGNAMVAMMAFVGGSFMPVSSLPEWFGIVAGWIPNGLALSAFMQAFQGAGFDVLSSPLLRLLIISIVLVGLSFILFPKRKVT
ncbi:ABC transporter permease [Bacillus horti]|uniref:ABC-2 type transport system permease protein n=1 Tax=Caldalkalibacillus horti TaxID=77523 RepID=A0ABT9VUR5_9BACI|nr:ABC transporter permease [Bacillus horti]MDQ0164727.1 ABC-2 type transport system permease protein [Bacillus horti]